MKDYKKAINETPMTLVEFYATWCPHCQAMEPVMDNVKKLLSGRAGVLQYDIDKYSQLADDVEIESVPTFILYDHGEEVWRRSGEMTASMLLAQVQHETASK